MISLWLLAACLVLLSYLLFWWSLRRPPYRGTTLQLPPILDAHRQRRQELAQELAEGRIDNNQFKQLVTELERDLLDLTADDSDPEPSRHWQGLLPVIITLGVLPLVALSLYFTLGRPDLIGGNLQPKAATARPQEKQAAPSLEAAIEILKQRLQANPESLEDWMLLARAYQATGKPQQALETYRQALKLAPDNPDLQLFYAEALARSQGGNPDGEPERLVQSVLKRFPEHPRALWMAGLIALQKSQTAQAEQYWQRLLMQMPAGSDASEQLAAVMEKAGMRPTRAKDSITQKVPAAIQVTVSLSPQLTPRTKPDQAVYIFARAAQGPPMPLAIVRKQVKDLPVTVTLDDAMAMIPQMKLSNFDRVVIGARVARSGNAKGASGDLEGWSPPVKIEQNKTITLVINQVRS